MQLRSCSRISRSLWTVLLARASQSPDASSHQALCSSQRCGSAPVLAASLSVPKRRRWAPPLHGQHGGAAVEYVLVTTFATLLSIGALAYVGSLVKERLTILAQRLGSEAPLPDFDVMGDNSP